MKQDNTLQKAILSEKAYQLMEKGIYTFFIAKKASKKDVKNSVEKMFSVNVEKVNISKSGSKQKRIAKTKKTVTVGGSKKALVYLKAGQSIAALSPKTEAKSKKGKDSKEKDVQKVSPEGKEV
ncbi:50S ribosomal protein L23 [Candidatus Curtissbacteria bacterium]|nr:50S ribosomal protein L23 [Candidatus Curtissbacteria bacterium]